MEIFVSGPALEPINEIVRAGAGAGKTYTLTHKVMDLADACLSREKRMPRLIVTTFTRKATQELRERLMLLALDEYPHLIDFVNSRAHLVVSTIHGIMDMFLKRFGAQIGLDPAYQILDVSGAEKLARQVFRQLVLSEDKFSVLLETFSFNVLVGLVRRIEQLKIENPEALPFALSDFEKIFNHQAEKTGRELKNCAVRIRAETDKATWIEIADGFYRLAALLEKQPWAGNRPAFLATFENLPTIRRSGKGAPPVSETTMELAKSLNEALKEFETPLYDPACWQLFSQQYELVNELAEKFGREFRDQKSKIGQLEIADLELLAMQCLRAEPKTGESFSSEWDFWLIDEYQDTSPFQVELLRKLVGDRPSFIVGDPQQSIYLFRGARSEVFSLKEKEIAASQGVRRHLPVNRRSKPELLLFFNDFFSKVNPPFEPMEPFFSKDQKINPNSEVVKIFIGADSELSAADGDSEVEESQGSEAEGVRKATAGAELQAIVAHVQSLLKKGSLPEEICVLGRTNRVLTEIADELARYDLPTHVHAAAGFFDRREIRDAISLLKFLINPHDNFNTVELIRSPWFKVPDAVIVRWAASRPESLWLVLAKNAIETVDAVKRLKSLLEKAEESSLTESFRAGLVLAGFVEFSHTHDVSGRREANLWKFLSSLQAEERVPGFNPIAFVSSSRNLLNLQESNQEGDAVAAVEPNRINLMTVHASKGLEFKNVIIPKMNQKPNLTTHEDFTFDEHAKKWAMKVPFGDDGKMTMALPQLAWLEEFQKQELAEHARVLYVALTRASESVFMSWLEKPGKGPNKNSWAEQVRLSLEHGIHREESYTYLVERSDLGQKLDDESSADDQKREEPTGESRESLPVRPLWNQESQKKSIAESTSVTDLLESEGKRVRVGNRDVVQLLKGASQGTAVHKLMELLKYPSRDRMELLIKKWFADDANKVLQAVQFVRQSQRPPLFEIIANGEVEKGFVFEESGKIVEGQIDLWGRTDAGEVWIVDYKTGSSRHREKAFRQMGLYTLALRKSGWVKPDEKISLAAVYPFAEEVYVESEPDLQQVRAWLTGNDTGNNSSAPR
jgi:ATP-dependent helicase/nuclease subunit A